MLHKYDTTVTHQMSFQIIKMKTTNVKNQLLLRNPNRHTLLEISVFAHSNANVCLHKAWLFCLHWCWPTCCGSFRDCHCEKLPVANRTSVSKNWPQRTHSHQKMLRIIIKKKASLNEQCWQQENLQVYLRKECQRTLEDVTLCSADGQWSARKRYKVARLAV